MGNGLNPHLQKAVHILSDISTTPRLDAEILMAHALNMERSEMLLHSYELSVPDNFQSFVERRLLSEPMAYIVGVQDFWDLTLKVTSDVLIPRPDSETMIDWAVQLFQDEPPKSIIDLGTGSGALLLAALSIFPMAHGVGIDKSQAAIDIAQYNSMLNNNSMNSLQDRSEFMVGDWTQPEWDKSFKSSFDLILCNPPYIGLDEILMKDVADFEPSSALFSGSKGLEDYQLLIPQLRSLLTQNGKILLEIGSTQAVDVSNIALQNDYLVIKKQDLAGLDRILLLE